MLSNAVLHSGQDELLHTSLRLSNQKIAILIDENFTLLARDRSMKPDLVPQLAQIVLNHITIIRTVVGG